MGNFFSYLAERACSPRWYDYIWIVPLFYAFIIPSYGIQAIILRLRERFK